MAVGAAETEATWATVVRAILVAERVEGPDKVEISVMEPGRQVAVRDTRAPEGRKTIVATEEPVTT